MAETENPEKTRVAILGAGSWGATLARLNALAGRDVVVWTRNSEKAAQLVFSRRIDEPLVVEFPPEVAITADLDHALADRDVIIFCCKAQAMRQVAARVRGVGKQKSAAAQDGKRPILVSAAKGIELGTFKRMSEILEEELPEYAVAALSGPNLAQEVLQGLPTASVVASNNEQCARSLQKLLSAPNFRVYSNTDLVGVELGGALKNIIAIAAGAVDGLRLGTNAKSALVTRALAEMTRMTVALGGRAATMAGLAGLGDLLATCSSSLSRNWRMGYHLCQGEVREEIEQELGAVAEGVDTTFAVVDLSKKLNIEMPIAEQVDIVLRGETNPRQAILNLMNRPLVSE